MIETSLLPHRSNLPSRLEVQRIKLYTRKLAEIERFIETRGVLPATLSDPNVRINRYWTA